MDNIQVAVIHESHDCPAGMMMFLAKLTQRGHSIIDMDDLVKLYNASIGNHANAKSIVALPHGTIKRFTPITIAIVGASRRFLAQARTNQVGMSYVSASLQYSDYSNKASFVVPYALLGTDQEALYLNSCEEAMATYSILAEASDNDTAGYVAPQGLRNILIMQGNHEAWSNFIRLRTCNRNTNETQYVTMLIWQALLKTADGQEMFAMAGPDCLYGQCREGLMSCGAPLIPTAGNTVPGSLLNDKWLKLRGVLCK